MKPFKICNFQNFIFWRPLKHGENLCASWIFMDTSTRCDILWKWHSHAQRTKWGKNFRQQSASKSTIFGTSYHTVSQKVEIFHMRSIWRIFVFTNAFRIIQSLRVPILSHIGAELQYLETAKVQDVLANHPGYRQRM